MTVDIIIPTYKPDETLCLLLHKLQGQTFVVHRVIILNTEEKLWKQAAAAYPIEQVLKELPCEYEVFHIAKKDFDHGGTRQFGAEIGISTQKLHARGPMGLREMTTMKYLICGDGQIR